MIKDTIASGFAAVLLVSSLPSTARDYFDPALLSLTGGQAITTDLSIFETADQVPPGEYLVTVYVNQSLRGQYTLMFTGTEKGQVEPQLTPAFLSEMGVNTAALASFTGLAEDKPVRSLSTLIPDNQVNFHFRELRLELSFPQVAMKPDAARTVDPAQWDDGVPAFLMNYSLSGGQNWQDDRSGKSEQRNLFALLRSGLNWQAWRLRSDLTYTHNESRNTTGATQNQQNTQFSGTYLQRDIRAWRSEILAGEYTTGNDVFDSIPFRGVRLNSSEEMLPFSQRGFAPVIAGIARSNARITISQNGNVVYQTYVAPGPFRIDDLYQTGQGGDLTVTVTEADGSIRTWTQAYSALPVMLRPGGWKYELTTGEYHGAVTVDSRVSRFALATLIFGLPGNITMYGGGLVAEDYLSFAGGTGLSLGEAGAISADITTSAARLQEGQNRQHGSSYRIRYAKSLLSTGTSIDLTAYRYSTRHYYSFADFNSQGYRLQDDQAPWVLARQRSAFQVRLSQQLGEQGSLYLSALHSSYWNDEATNRSLSAGYNGSLKGISYGLAYSIDRVKGNGTWPENRQFALNVQVPFSLFGHGNGHDHSYASYQMTHTSNGQVQQQAGVSGSTLSDRLSWSVMQGWTNDHHNSSVSNLNLGWQGSRGMASMGYSNSRHNRSLNINGNGGVVIHPQGITFGPMLGNAVAVVSAPGADGVTIMNGNLLTDSRGYAIVPYLSGYQPNNISLNPATLPDAVDLPRSSQTVYPTKGAVVLANFTTRIGYQALMTLEKDGAPVPFGAIVTVMTENDDTNTGIVGDAGQAWLSGLPEAGQVSVSWGSDATQQCRARFDLSGSTPVPGNPIRTLHARCESGK